ncbi:hypothetical protein E4U15_005820 [Claviceps sp. LM218 group G6]|nr:hypothetical protein E4U15_005820 [Claviceps sp. LM218 group G6]
MVVTRAEDGSSSHRLAKDLDTLQQVLRERRVGTPMPSCSKLNVRYLLLNISGSKGFFDMLVDATTLFSRQANKYAKQAVMILEVKANRVVPGQMLRNARLSVLEDLIRVQPDLFG